MDQDGARIWRKLRRAVVAAGPSSVLARIAARHREELADVMREHLDDDQAARLLGAIGGGAHGGKDAHDELVRLFVALARTKVQVTSEAAERAALRVLDVWAASSENPGAIMSGRVAQTIGTCVAQMTFESSRPGSGPSCSAWELDGSVVQVSEDIGAYAVNLTLASVIGEWLDFADADITCRSLGREAISSRRRRRTSDQLGASYPVRINRTWWTVEPDGRLTNPRRLR